MAVDVCNCLVNTTEYTKKPFVITVVTAKHAEWLLQTVDQSDQNSWVQALQAEAMYVRPNAAAVQPPSPSKSKTLKKGAPLGGFFFLILSYTLLCRREGPGRQARKGGGQGQDWLVCEPPSSGRQAPVQHHEHECDDLWRSLDHAV